jgi:hypothetical protein
VAGATSYQVDRCTGIGSESWGSAIGSPASSPYDHTGGTSGITYCCQVKPCAGASNCSAYDAGRRFEHGLYLPFIMR